ncbi:hypothetical protein [Aeromonas allosaccharophila]|uniref:hypothetical protein n=1 Tax=Aeromonas allosaccharophila TaxID=656 RepID=UPI0035BBE45F
MAFLLCVGFYGYGVMFFEDEMYLIELFSAKEDQVKLVTFAFSALLAVSVLLINQPVGSISEALSDVRDANIP